MNDAVIDATFSAYKTQLSELLEKLRQLTIDAGSTDLQEIVSNLRTQINEPFLFVIVGEVKSGKSSFINALLQEEVCRVDPAPCTDRVQQIVYSESRKEWALNPQLTKIGLPIDILKTIAIVDTPGTNTVIAHHQEITEKFIPYSDLVVFVFSAKNPHTQSAWDLLAFVSEEWHRKIIFVLQQADIASEHELEVNVRAVREYARKKNITSPQIFSTSAKWEIEKDSRSGFDQIRQFIRETVTGGQHVRQKLQSNASAAMQVANNLHDSLNEQKRLLDSDMQIQEKIKSRLSVGKDKSTYEIESLIQLLVSNYNRIANYIKDDFREGLSVTAIISKSLASLFKRDRSVEVWMSSLKKRFEERLTTAINDVSQEGARHFIDGIRILLRDLLSDLESSKLPRSQNVELLVRVGESRQEVIDDVKVRVENLMKDEAFIGALSPAVNIHELGKAFMGGGSLALIGAIIALSSKAALVDITGGAIAASGLLFAGATLLVKKKSIVKKFNDDLDKNEARFAADLREKLTTKLKIIYDRIDREFEPLYQHVDQEKRRIVPLFERNEALLQQLRRLSDEINDGNDKLRS